MADGKSGLGAFIGVSCVAVCLNFWFWSQFASNMDFYQKQQPAICYDGRRMGADLLDARIGVDDSQRNKGTITMKCSFAVAVYPCYDEDIDPGDWDGRCNTLSSSVMYSDGQWPRREDDPDIKCCERDCIGSNRCSDKKWSCTGIGGCDAYDKSIRICASRLKGPYKCFSIEGDDEVREDSTGFPVVWLMLGVLASCCALGVCGFMIFALSETENLTKKVLSGLMVVGGFVACCFVIFLIVRLVRGEPDRRGIVEKDMKDIGLVTGSGSNETLVLAAEPPPPEGLHWAIIVLIVLGSVVGLLCVGFCCIFAFHFCKELGWSARAKACESDSTARAEAVAEDGPMKGVSNFSVFSAKANRDIAKDRSRKDLNDLVKSASNISLAEKVGHSILSHAEDTRNLARSFNPLAKAKLESNESNENNENNEPPPLHRPQQV